jgi:hypothetical protein
MNKREQVKTAKMIHLIGAIVEKVKQKNIKRILKRLNKMSPNDVTALVRILGA